MRETVPVLASFAQSAALMASLIPTTVIENAKTSQESSAEAVVLVPN